MPRYSVKKNGEAVQGISMITLRGDLVTKCEFRALDMREVDQERYVSDAKYM
jgi:hypothetical protein